ncbi:recombinase family protein [Rickettsia endosymbiont of Halotydeus destructor]|uniref:recombinase family protein n=1 Tax=Rickettsia endosymbiont of Halotydeus destructor TaxID=2996754 RepID=UPI003BB21ABC
MIERKVATKAILLSRVSSKEQEEGYSINAQKHRMQEYCIRKGLEVLKVFEFAESSTKGDRKKFMESIDFAKKHKEIIAVVTDKVDRLQRSYEKVPLLNKLIKEEKIELHFYTENCIIHKYSTNQERMLWNIFIMLAQNYVDSLKDNINRAISQKLREGRWVSTAPIGYLHVKKDVSKRGQSDIVIDENRAVLVKRIFELYATGNYSLIQILKKTKEWGLTNSRGNQGHLCKSHIYKIIQNPFYYGVMRLLKTGKEYPHKYPTIIDKSLFDTCKRIRLNWGRKAQGKYREKEFIFRGLIRCANSGRIVTPDLKKKTYVNGKVGQWTYLRMWDATNHAKAIYVPETIALQEVENVFKSMKLSRELLQEVITYIKTSANAEKDYHKKRLSELYAENTKLKTRMDRLMDLFLDGELSKAEHEEKRQQLAQKREDTIKEIEAHNKADDNFARMLISLVELASDAHQTFIGSTIAEKRSLVNLVFSNLSLNGEKLDFMLRPPFDSFIEIPKTGEWWR